jgi:hypothetical protein
MRSFINCTLHWILLGRSNEGMMNWVGNVTCMGGRRNAYKILVGKPKRKRPHGRPSSSGEDNVKIDLREI